MPLTTQYLTSEYSTIKTKDITKYIHVLFFMKGILKQLFFAIFRQQQRQVRDYYLNLNH